MKSIFSLLSTIALISILSTSVLGFKIQNQPSQLMIQNRPKIPSYLGLGYHILLGNPYANHVDQGFRAPIFNFTYNKSQTTQDDKYLIPDYTHSMQSISCSIQSKISQFTGTKNYQKQLQNSTKFDTRLSYSFLQAAFTYSRTFRQFSNQTQTNKQTSYQSNAQCHVYTLDMPLYSNQISLNNDFIEGVRSAYAKKQWQEFINHFGTHYASTIIYGGRYLLQHTYTEYSMSLFTSMKLDINLAAKIQYFNKIGISLSEDMKKYQNQTNLINSHVQTNRLSTIGGLPPKSGDWNDWVGTVKQNLAPVGYRLSTLSVLFNFIHSFDAAGAIKSFQGYLNTYCERNKCPPLTPDRPKPKPLIVSYSKSAEISGPAKSSHTYDTNDGTLKAGMRVNKILMGSQGSIDSIQFFLSDGIVEHALPVIGNRQFNHQYLVPKSDDIKCVRFGITYNGSYWKFTSMQFVTRSGAESEVFTGSYHVNQYRILCVENNQEHFIGFFGRYGNTFDSIGLNIMKENMQN